MSFTAINRVSTGRIPEAATVVAMLTRTARKDTMPTSRAPARAPRRISRRVAAFALSAACAGSCAPDFASAADAPSAQ
jgi:hypothetical protein